MGIIGKALGDYFRGVGGQFSFEFPSQLQGEIIDLVNTCNSSQPTGTEALFVTDESGLAGTVATTNWAQLLSWRTGHDRIFAWVRSTGQPDSSFLSVVKKVIDDKFPGGDGSNLSIKQLSHICLEEIWTHQGLSINSQPFNSFLEVLDWVLSAAMASFEKYGSGLLESWSDQYLLYCSQLMDRLDNLITSYQTASGVSAQNSWEVFRLGGLPLPIKTDSNVPSILGNPPDLSKLASGKNTISIWERAFEDYILTGSSTLFFSVLDRLRGSATPNAWWSFNWPMVPTTIRPILIHGQDVFLHEPFTAWSDITIGQIERALIELGQPAPLSLGQCPQIEIIAGQADSAILATRQGQVSHSHTTQKWRARITLNGLSLDYKSDWNQLHLQQTQPGQPQVSDAWVDPSNIILVITLGNVTCSNLRSSVVPNNILHVDFDIEIEYSASRSHNALEEQ